MPPHDWTTFGPLGVLVDWASLRRSGARAMLMAVVGAGMLGTLVFGAASLWSSL